MVILVRDEKLETLTRILSLTENEVVKIAWLENFSKKQNHLQKSLFYLLKVFILPEQLYPTKGLMKEWRGLIKNDQVKNVK